MTRAVSLHKIFGKLLCPFKSESFVTERNAGTDRNSLKSSYCINTYNEHTVTAISYRTAVELNRYGFGYWHTDYDP